MLSLSVYDTVNSDEFDRTGLPLTAAIPKTECVYYRYTGTGISLLLTYLLFRPQVSMATTPRCSRWAWCRRQCCAAAVKLGCGDISEKMKQVHNFVSSQ